MAKRRDLFDPADPGHLRPEQRLNEGAAILAAGVIRMRKQRRVATTLNGQRGPHRVSGAASPRCHVAACVPKISPESRETCLELSRRSSPDGQCG